MLCYYLLQEDNSRIILNQGGFLRLNQDCIAVGGVRLLDEIPFDSGIREIFDFWKTYFMDTMKFNEAEARLRAAERIQISLEDDIDILAEILQDDEDILTLL